ncbi:M28 family metallopeptidase [Rheinheimera sp.]|uniref:M28 family metallopeptidase n=1 Tax=Rheinheimera sp. TaxID=1869214 RepID=UPI0027B99C62|nr:M28 family metallopeptidase [Rheinheimera sp.]
MQTKTLMILSSTLSSILLLSACSATSPGAEAPAVPQVPVATAAQGADANRIAAHMQFLADDALEGRDTGSKGHLIASNYIATNFQQLGLQPAGDNGGFFQKVPLKQSKLVNNSASLTLHINGKDMVVPYPKHFFTGPSSHEGKVAVKDAELVFVGYGMVSKEFGLDDYAGLDVKGKVVVMLPGRPSKLPSEEAAHLGSLKQRLAAEHGAIGIITLHTPQEEKTRPYANSLMYLNSARVRWVNDKGVSEGDYPQLKAGAYLHMEAAKPLFDGAKESLDSIFAKLEKKEVPTGFALNAKMSFGRESTHTDIQSQNVAAVLEGSDPTLKNEYVVVTAHSDHIGIGNDLRSKDKINNGLMDNAAGVAILLETARLYSAAPVKPKRSILFVAVTGEEKGLLGADYFAHHPVKPMQSLVANVNLDMPVLLYPFADMIAFGANHSTLGAVVGRATAKHGIKLSADPMPEQAIFTRSDHYTLVKKGVPSVFLMTGFTSKDPAQKGGEIWGKFFAKHYHKPTDDLAGLTKDFGPIRYDAGALFADINYAIGEEIANSEQRPQWLKASFFGNTFGHSYNMQK